MSLIALTADRMETSRARKQNDKVLSEADARAFYNQQYSISGPEAVSTTRNSDTIQLLRILGFNIL